LNVPTPIAALPMTPEIGSLTSIRDIPTLGEAATPEIKADALKVRLPIAGPAATPVIGAVTEMLDVPIAGAAATPETVNDASNVPAPTDGEAAIPTSAISIVANGSSRTSLGLDSPGYKYTSAIL